MKSRKMYKKRQDIVKPGTVGTKNENHKKSKLQEYIISKQILDKYKMNKICQTMHKTGKYDY